VVDLSCSKTPASGAYSRALSLATEALPAGDDSSVARGNSLDRRGVIQGVTFTTLFIRKLGDAAAGPG
jgi:hypothetical protein